MRDNRRILTRILLGNWNTVGNISLRIINRSLESGKFSVHWKESVVTPVEKIKNTIKYEEYRPINTLRTCDKLLRR